MNNTRQLTQEQLKLVEEKARPIFEHLQRKKALEWARQLEEKTSDLANTDLNLYLQAQDLITRLEWVACPIINNDREFLSLVKNHFLEGLKLDVNFTDLVTAKFETLFGVGLRKSIIDMLTALRANEQNLGSSPIKRKGQTELFKPTIKNWLADFLENTENRNPGPTEEAQYLFNNQNAKQLSEEERKTLGKVLSFYNTFKLYADGLAVRERMYSPQRPAPTQRTQSPSVPSSAPKPFRVTSRGIYREPSELSKAEPKIEGNVIDLKNK